jgi:uncharacterized membrane protein AbrB (regulator of aidB expression)
MRKAMLFFCGLVFLVVVSRVFFERLHLYNEFFWLDIPMHIIGGFLSYHFLESLFAVKKKKMSFVFALSLFLLCASVWEWYEYFIRQVVERDIYGYLDTVKDYMDGVIGLSLAYFSSKYKNI